MAYTRLREILVAGLRYVPFFVYVGPTWCYIGCKSKQYTSVLPTANTASVWGSTSLLILEVYHCVQTNEYAAVLTNGNRQLFFDTRDKLAALIPAPHTTSFVIRSDELLTSK